MTTNNGIQSNKESEVKHFNNVSTLPRYRRPNEVHEALGELEVGIKGRFEKGYPVSAIAKALNTTYPDHPVYGKITSRQIRNYLLTTKWGSADSEKKKEADKANKTTEKATGSTNA